ncbi:MAG TPA: M13 family metallopeptidase [Steroidobacteraceae bacterium]|nr:M13 family metallopeptidase [Steroidobacteraceae bacterium]
MRARYTVSLNHRIVECMVSKLSPAVLVCSAAAAVLGAVLPCAAAPVSGLDPASFDRSVRPQDDIYRYVNARWIAATPIPQDKSQVTTFSQINDKVLDDLHTLVDEVAQDAAAPAGSNRRKIADLYASFMDEKAVEDAGLGALKGEFAAIDAVKSRRELPALFAHLDEIGVTTPYVLGVGPDARDSTRYAVGVDQDGLGMPDRDYYLKDDDARLSEVRGKYLAHVGRMLALAGEPQGTAQAEARRILALETRIAQAQWTKVELRDPVKTYNKTAIAALDTLTPGYDWQPWLEGTGIAHKADYVIVGEPGYFKAFAGILASEPLSAWKAYLRWHLLSDYSPYLGKAFVDEHFAFYGTALQGTPVIQPRWKRGLALIGSSMGEALGELYVAKYFPPATKVRMQQLVQNLIAAYRADIGQLDWMGPQTRQQALQKLAKLHRKIGYPDRWRDYSTLTIVRGDLVGDVMRANRFESRRQVNKLGKPIDRGEWDMTPQTVNAYYDPQKNEIVFPAAILQPPFFDPAADDAVNYGAIGAVIGHEISHGYDDQGSQFDADGNLRDWWTKADHEHFAAKTAALVAQYDAFEPLPGYHVNGRLCLGEDIADNSGLAIAYKAYHLALHGRAAPVLDGLTGDQRFMLAFSRIWRSNTRDKTIILRLKTDPHAPPPARGTLPLQNLPAFYAAFDVKPGDRLYRPPQQRVLIW